MGDRRDRQPLLVLFVDVYVARMTTPVTTAEVSQALARFGIHCGTNELYDALDRHPYLRRADGQWHPHHRRSTDPRPQPARCAPAEPDTAGTPNEGARGGS